MDLSIVIVNFNTRDLLKNCLTSIFKQRGVEYEVWVVDNASRDGSAQMVEKDFTQVKLIKNKENLGFAKGNNLALRQAQSKYLFLLNPDTIVKEGSLSKLVDFLEKNPQAGAVGAKILNPDGSLQSSVGKFYDLGSVSLMLFGGERAGFLRSSPSKMGEVDWVSGAALAVRKEVFENVGGLDENFFMYMEEVEWCYRIRKAGFKIFFYPEVEIVHYERASGSKSQAIWGIYQGLILFFQKHKPPWQVIILRALLKTKAALALIIGFLTGNDYLKTTYIKAFSLI